jgi:FkbM family methyltransferase
MTLPRILKKARAALDLWRGREINLGGNTYRIKGYFINRLALRDGNATREPWLDAIYVAVLRCRSGAFIDVGANIGQTMFKVLSLDPSRQYVGFEPQVSCCFLIQHFLEDNRLTNCAVLPVGLSNKNGAVRLYLRGGEYDSAASIVENFRPQSFYTFQRFVCLRKGDELLSELRITSISAIKIDVEGGELEVIDGLVGTIRARKPFIIFEVLNHFLVETGNKLDEQHIPFRQARIEQMEATLRQSEYVIFNILPGNCLTKVSRIVPPNSADLSITNYIAISSADVDSFLQVFSGSVSNS